MSQMEIEIDGLELRGFHGATAEEQEAGQRFLFDVWLVAHDAGVRTDHLDDTIDYKKVSKRLQSFVSESQFQLVETLTERIAEIIVKEFHVPWVKVKLNKQGALRGSKDVGIIIERRAEDYA